VSGPLHDLATTRVASLCLNRRGRPRGLTYDDHLVRGALILDLALCGALSHTDDAVELDHARAAAHGLAEPARQADEGDGSLLHWLDWGEFGFDDWADALVEAGIWRVRPRRPWYPWRRFEDTARHRTTADRRAGSYAVRTGTETPQTCGVVALGSISRLLGAIADPPDWTLEDLGEARWAGEFVVNRLAELRIRMRAIGRAAG
jgi:hypothetical protein